MKKLIVNADDLGASHGINRAVFECHHRGIVTSSSLMVDMPGAAEAAELAQSSPNLSIGLHTVLTEEDCSLTVDLSEPEVCRDEVRRQLDKFYDLIGSMPSHLDAHHNIYRNETLTPIFLSIAREYSLPLREHSAVRYFPDFYGQWDDGESHLEWIGFDNLELMLAREIGDGVTELSCHPGYVDNCYESSYLRERETEVKTLCDPRLGSVLERLQLQLTNYLELGLSQAG